MTTFEISTPTEFSFRECLVFLNRSPLECLHRVQGESILKSIIADNQHILFSITHAGEALHLEQLTGRPSEATKANIIDYVNQWFDLDRDIRPFYKLAAQDELLRPLKQDYFGLRLIGIPDFTESICWAIIGQQINLRFAYTLKQRLVMLCGKKLHYEGMDYWRFPAAAAIAALSPEQLRNIQFSRQKIDYILDITKMIASGALSPQQLRTLPEPSKIREALAKIRGIGNWTAEYVMMKYFRLPAAFPVQDVGLHNAIKAKLNLPQKPTLAQIQELAAGWKGWEAYATFYLWRSLYA